MAYTKKVDAVLYESAPTSTLTESEFADLAMASLDQAGADLPLQGKVRKLLEDAGLFNAEASDGN